MVSSLVLHFMNNMVNSTQGNHHTKSSYDLIKSNPNFSLVAGLEKINSTNRTSNSKNSSPMRQSSIFYIPFISTSVPLLKGEYVFYYVFKPIERELIVLCMPYSWVEQQQPFFRVRYQNNKINNILRQVLRAWRKVSMAGLRS